MVYSNSFSFDQFTIEYNMSRFVPGDSSNAPQGGEIEEYRILLNGVDCTEIPNESLDPETLESIQEAYRLAEDEIYYHYSYAS